MSESKGHKHQKTLDGDGMVIQATPLLQRVIRVGERIIAGCERDRSVLGAPQWLRASKQYLALYNQVRELSSLDDKIASLETLVARLEESTAVS